jgi:hypothetical protein
MERDHLEDRVMDGIRMDLRGIGLMGVDWIRLAQDRGQWPGCCECGDEPSGSCATELVSAKILVEYVQCCLVFCLSSFSLKTPFVLLTADLLENLYIAVLLRACLHSGSAQHVH